jgi:hypothetical protein
MAAPASERFSLASQPLDRAAFIACRLGAVLPLAALAWLTRRFVLPHPHLARDRTFGGLARGELCDV